MSSCARKPIPDKQPETIRVTRPWGGFAQYVNNEEVTVSLMTVEAGQRLSLQSHSARAELWIALDDGAIIQVDEQIIEAKAGDEIWIPAGSKHRLGSGGEAARVLELAFGNWRQEDIRRYADDYDRSEAGE